MAYRGRGRGRFGGGRTFAKQEPFELFPDVELPPVRDVSKEERALVVWSSRLQNYWKSSPYYLKETNSSMSQSIDIERFSDQEKMKAKPTRDSFMQFLEANASNFPRELVAGLQKLDLFEKLEQKYQGQEEKGEKEKKEGEEEEPDDGVEEVDEEFSDDGDYNQNVDFDDDEDDFNMADDNDDEGIF